MIRPLIALACLSLPQALMAQHLLRLSASPEHPQVGQPVTVIVEFSNPRETPPWCGLIVRFGDREEQEVRVAATPLTLHKTYSTPGVYTIGVDGQMVVRGLKTAFPCGGAALSMRLQVQAPVPPPPASSAAVSPSRPADEALATPAVPVQGPKPTNAPKPEPRPPIPVAKDRVFPR